MANLAYKIAGYRRFPLDMFVLPTTRGGRSITFAVIDDFLRLEQNIDGDTGFLLADKIAKAVMCYKSTILTSLQSEEYGEADGITAETWGVVLPVSQKQIDDDVPEAKGIATKDIYYRSYTNTQTIAYKELLEKLLRRFAYIGNAFKSFNEAAQSFDAVPSKQSTQTTITTEAQGNTTDFYNARGATPNALANGKAQETKQEETQNNTEMSFSAVNQDTRAAALEVFAGDIVSRFVEYFESILDYKGD